MKPLLIEHLRELPDAFRRRSVTREFLQARILLSLQDHGAFSNWAFVGGTALRFLFNLPRYSEDLDFSLVSAGTDVRFEKLMRAVRGDLHAEAYTVEIKVRADKTVASAMIKFRGLLHELGISPLQDETIAVKVEIDTNPPQGAGTDIKAVRRHFMLNLQHYDAASLLAGKLHAVLSRKYTKGRDLYDLAWYLVADHPKCTTSGHFKVHRFWMENGPLFDLMKSGLDGVYDQHPESEQTRNDTKSLREGVVAAADSRRTGDKPAHGGAPCGKVHQGSDLRLGGRFKVHQGSDPPAR